VKQKVMTKKNKERVCNHFWVPMDQWGKAKIGGRSYVCLNCTEVRNVDVWGTVIKYDSKKDTWINL
jgi:hypothetical protein